MVEDLRILFLHEMEGAPGGEKQRLLEKAIGKYAVKAPNLKTRQNIMMFVLLCVVTVLLCLSGVIVSAVLCHWYIPVAVLIISVVLLATTHWVGGRGATQYMLNYAVKIAEKKFGEVRPHVIVGASFGAVVALSMDVPKVPLLLLSPAHEQYSRFMRLKHGWKLSDYPYVMIVHGSNDKNVPLDDSIRLVETTEVGRCRLEVIDDGHALKAVTADDLKAWVEEVYTNGRTQVLKMAREGKKNVDPSLFAPTNDATDQNNEYTDYEETEKLESTKSTPV